MAENGYGFYQQELPREYMSENGSHDFPSGSTSAAEIPLGPLHNPAIPGILRENGASGDAIAKVFNRHGEVIYTTEDDIDFRDPNLQLFTAEAALYDRTKPLYDLADYRLRGDKPPHGYSHHNLEQHIVPMAAMVQNILDMGKYPKHTKMLGLMAAYGHDLGNVNRRKGHSFDSPDLFAQVVPSVTRNDHDWQVIKKVMMLHDEKAMMAEMKSWGPLSVEDRILKILEMGEAEGLRELPPVLAAIILADKADIDRNRINEWAVNHEAVADDEHVWVNLCAENQGFFLSPNGKELTLRINFNQNANSAEDLKKFGPVMRKRSHHKSDTEHENYRIHVPDRIHETYQNTREEYFKQWTTSLENIYKDRIELMAYMAFVALPIDKFAIEMVDPEDGTSLSRPFTPELMDKQMAVRSLKFESEKTRKEYLSLYERSGEQSESTAPSEN
jgi:hypothetical protein